MIDLDDIYRQLAHPWTHERLAAHYQDAERRGAPLLETARQAPEDELNRPIALLATAIPPAASLSVAIHVLHALPAGTRGGLAQELVDIAEQNAADALHRCQRVLELDGAAHDYAADEWLPVAYDTARPLLESACLNAEPPSLVRHTQDAVSWLSRAVVELDRDSTEAPTALADALARLLIVWVFAETARRKADEASE